MTKTMKHTHCIDIDILKEWVCAWLFSDKTLFTKADWRTLYSKARWHRFNFSSSFSLITAIYLGNHSAVIIGPWRYKVSGLDRELRSWRMSPPWIPWIFSLFLTCPRLIGNHRGLRHRLLIGMNKTNMVTRESCSFW